MMSISLKSLALATGTTALVLGSLSPASAFTVFTNRALWQAAVDAITGSVTTTDTFNTNIVPAQSIVLSSGIVSTNSFPPDVTSTNSVSGGRFLNATDGDATASSATVTWTFPSAVRAFGANFFGATAGRLTLTGDFDGTGNQTLPVNSTIGGENGFLGVIGDANFGSIVFGNATNANDNFSIDNASFATVSAPTGVPEPSTVAGLLFSGVGLLVARRGRRA
jgi:hypothetical protein